MRIYDLNQIMKSDTLYTSHRGNIISIDKLKAIRMINWATGIYTNRSEVPGEADNIEIDYILAKKYVSRLEGKYRLIRLLALENENRIERAKLSCKIRKAERRLLCAIKPKNAKTNNNIELVQKAWQCDKYYTLVGDNIFQIAPKGKHSSGVKLENAVKTNSFIGTKERCMALLLYRLGVNGLTWIIRDRYELYNQEDVDLMNVKLKREKDLSVFYKDMIKEENGN